MEGDRRAEILHRITPQMIEKIEVHKGWYGYSQLIIPDINSSNSKNLLAECMHDLTYYHPNHDVHEHEFFLRMFISNGEVYECSLYSRPGIRNKIFMMMFNRIGGRKFFIGHRESSALYRWLDYHKLIENYNP